jgi:hypothetical protein
MGTYQNKQQKITRAHFAVCIFNASVKKKIKINKDTSIFLKDIDMKGRGTRCLTIYQERSPSALSALHMLRL